MFSHSRLNCPKGFHRFSASLESTLILFRPSPHPDNLLNSTHSLGLVANCLIVVGPSEVVVILLVSVVAGFIGAMFGLGGGILIIPFLTLVEGVPVPLAVGASIVSVVATSSSSAATYVQDHLTNLRLGMFLEIGTVAGAITGAFVAVFLPASALFILFGLILLYATIIMIRARGIDFPANVRPDSASRILALGS